MVALMIPMIIAMVVNMESRWGSRCERWSDKVVSWSLMASLAAPCIGAVWSGYLAVTA